MAKVFVFDFDICNGCHNCQVACKDEHCEQAWMPYAQEQPMIGQFWMKLAEKTRGQVPVVKVSYKVEMCNHCEDAPCIDAGEGAVYRRDDGLVIIDPEKAKGMRQLVESCPVGAIYWNEKLEIPQKCTGCAHLLDNGWDVPRCVDACPTEALRYIDEQEVDLSQATVSSELEECGPRLYYINEPKRFVAGTYVDLANDEVVIGAQVELLDAKGGMIASQETDDFGDFKFDQVEPSAYTVCVNGHSYKADVTEQDRYIGVLDAST